MQVAHPNILAAIVMALIYMGLAKVWYSKAVFGKMWADCCSSKKEADSCCKASTGQLIGCFIQAFVTAFILGYIVNAFQPMSMGEGVKVGLLAWLGFSAMGKLCGVIWNSKPLTAYFIDIGFTFVVYAIWGAAFAVWH